MARLLVLTLITCLLIIIDSQNVYGKNGVSSVLDNGVIGDPQVDCMEDRVKLTFRTEKPFHGRIFVKGMSDNDKCVSDFKAGGGRPGVDFEVVNGECNMRRTRKISADERGVEQSITIIISFHDTFITKVDKAYRCTCFYMEADKVVTSKFDVSMLPTTDLIISGKMPQCSYNVRRGSVNGPIVNFATVGESVFHVWQCDSDMFSMLVHSCFVDDGAGQDRKPLLSGDGCTIDPVIVPDLTYNQAANLAFTEVSTFKFADKVTTYFQCAVSTCMVSEGMCEGKTPPRCSGINAATFPGFTRSKRSSESNSTSSESVSATPPGFDFTMDLSADKIVVFDLDDDKADNDVTGRHGLSFKPAGVVLARDRTESVCFSQASFVGLTVLAIVLLTTASVFLVLHLVRQRKSHTLSPLKY